MQMSQADVKLFFESLCGEVMLCKWDFHGRFCHGLGITMEGYVGCCVTISCWMCAGCAFKTAGGLSSLYPHSVCRVCDGESCSSWTLVGGMRSGK